MATSRPSSLNIAILAAGQGKRMRSGMPKVLHPLAGRPLLAYVLDTARKLAADRICVVYGHGGEAVRKRFPDPDLAWALQDPPQGTGHALAQALPQLAADGVTLVLFGADPLARAETLESVVRHARNGALSLLTIELDDPTGYGRIVRGSDGKVTAIVEQKDATPEQRRIREINSGVMAAPTECFARWLAAIDNRNASGEYYLTDVIARAVKEGVPVETTRDDERHRDARCEHDARAGASSSGSTSARRRTRCSTRASRLPIPRASTSAARSNAGAMSRSTSAACSKEPSGWPTASQVAAYCVLKNATVGAGSQIAPFSHLEDATVGANCRVGPYARLRPGAMLADDVHIGNFVEVKASTIGRGSKANHLAYIGDTTIGTNVNFGAGSITANYDGANKYPTVIEDDVAHRLELRAGRAGESRPRCDHRRRQHDRRRRARRDADRRTGPAGERARLEAAREETESPGRLTPCAALSARSPRATSFRC